MAIALRGHMQLGAGTLSDRPGSARPRGHGAEQARALVLVADDYRRGRVRVALERDGHEVLATRSGRRAATLLKDGRHCPDVVVLDMRLPQEDGVAFAAAYRRAPAPHPPIILVPAPEQAVPREVLDDDDPAAGLLEDRDSVDDAVTDAALDLLRARVRLHSAQSRARSRARGSRTPLYVAAAGVAAALVLGAAAAAPALAWG